MVRPHRPMDPLQTVPSMPAMASQYAARHTGTGERRADRRQRARSAAPKLASTDDARQGRAARARKHKVVANRQGTPAVVPAAGEFRVTLPRPPRLGLARGGSAAGQSAGVAPVRQRHGRRQQGRPATVMAAMRRPSGCAQMQCARGTHEITPPCCEAITRMGRGDARVGARPSALWHRLGTLRSGGRRIGRMHSRRC